MRQSPRLPALPASGRSPLNRNSQQRTGPGRAREKATEATHCIPYKCVQRSTVRKKGVQVRKKTRMSMGALLHLKCRTSTRKMLTNRGGAQPPTTRWIVAGGTSHRAGYMAEGEHNTEPPLEPERLKQYHLEVYLRFMIAWQNAGRPWQDVWKKKANRGPKALKRSVQSFPKGRPCSCKAESYFGLCVDNSATHSARSSISTLTKTGSEVVQHVWPLKTTGSVQLNLRFDRKGYLSEPCNTQTAEMGL